MVNGHTSFDHDIYVLSHRLPVFVVYLVISRNIDYKPYNMTTSKHLIHRMVQSDAGHLIFVYFIMLKIYLNIKNGHLLDVSFGIWKYNWKCDFSQTGLTFIMIYSYFLETTPSQSNVFRGTFWTETFIRSNHSQGSYLPIRFKWLNIGRGESEKEASAATDRRHFRV